ncbi:MULTISPECIES: MoaD/ThiS family protein [Chryseobacterium]|uniref:Molybdopterin converting factor, small subunit n=2 Tax=Chryseobacterium TaxID=59732 RepID=A0AAX2ILG3_9FLAO|nr:MULTISPECIES: MoaD/ThiS family protein [Chryseobacterium]AYM99165.1 MoaD/ThiS family protein [Chryseobacterium sp. 3008163]AZB29672.1 MoaD/ThiS family protein [Chryseobacterium balustinum]MCD0477855.1 MoaD/ThiS family protein [Chryseobacterium sp. LC2016-29]SFZ93183.1 Molybdopterin converting factor, small subunit [Chryseobacterium limigenitum]SKB92343.1 Molybdopterin converting factor, small subunit [Chryseobacterium balustinum]
MKLKIFGKLTDIFTTDEYNFSLENIKSIAELKLMLEKEFPKLKETTYLVAVNGTKAENTQAISNVSEIALLPPYSGG